MFHTEVLEKIKTHILFSVIFSPENRVVYELMWKNMVQPDRPQVTVQHGEEQTRFVYQITTLSIEARP
jgi:hypothetical protein